MSPELMDHYDFIVCFCFIIHLSALWLTLCAWIEGLSSNTRCFCIQYYWNLTLWSPGASWWGWFSRSLNEALVEFESSDSKYTALNSDSHLKTFFIICFNDSPSKMMKNAFLFHLRCFKLNWFKLFSFSRYLNFCLDVLGM